MAAHKRKKFTHCVVCGKPPTARRPLSARGLHESCGLAKMRAAAEQMKAKEGPYYDRWRVGMQCAIPRIRESVSD